MEMVQENLKTASEAQIGEFTESDLEMIEKVKRIIRENEKIGCTGCRYCMPCPQGVEIPGIFRSWNTMYTESKFSGMAQYFQAFSLADNPGYASQCIGCGKCEKHCPQGLPIRQKLKEADKDLRPFYARPAFYFGRKIMLRRPKKNKS